MAADSAVTGVDHVLQGHPADRCGDCDIPGLRSRWLHCPTALTPVPCRPSEMRSADHRTRQNRRCSESKPARRDWKSHPALFGRLVIPSGQIHPSAEHARPACVPADWQRRCSDPDRDEKSQSHRSCDNRDSRGTGKRYLPSFLRDAWHQHQTAARDCPESARQLRFHAPPTTHCMSDHHAPAPDKSCETR